jgi:membrane protease YdiL (CAAX protease family)
VAERYGGQGKPVKPSHRWPDAPRVEEVHQATPLQRGRGWAPTPVPEGVDLSIATVAAIALGMYLVANAISWHVAGPFFSYVGWRYEPSIDAVVRQALVPALLEVGLWLGIVVALGWRRAVGFGGGSMSAWGTVPLAASCLLLFGAVGTPSIADRGLPLLGIALVSTFVAAFSEELAFRGFLLHGLSRRLGGVAGVGISSGLFALAHLPSMIGSHQRFVLPMLAFLFGSGVFYAKIRIATGSIWYPTAAHAFVNVLTLLYANWGTEEGIASAVFTVVKLGEPMVGLVLWAMLAPVARTRLASAQPEK